MNYNIISATGTIFNVSDSEKIYGVVFASIVGALLMLVILFGFMVVFDKDIEIKGGWR